MNQTTTDYKVKLYNITKSYITISNETPLPYSEAVSRQGNIIRGASTVQSGIKPNGGSNRSDVKEQAATAGWILELFEVYNIDILNNN